MSMSSTDLLSSRLGFGCGRLKGGSDKPASLSLVHAALDHGIRYFDTAPPYGLGASESVLGEALKGRPETVLIATKAGLARPASPGLLQKARAVVKPMARWVPGLRQAVLKGMALRAPAGNFGPDFIARSFETSLQQLQRERVDLLLLHEAQPHDTLEPLLAVLERHVASGQLGAYGSSTGEAMKALVRFGSVQQYRCPAPGAEWAPPAAQDVLHGALRFIAPAIAPALARDRQLQDRLAALLPPGTEPAVASGSLALAYALARFESRLLISTQQAQRLSSTLAQLRHICTRADWRPAMAALHAGFKRAPAP